MTVALFKFGAGMWWAKAANQKASDSRDSTIDALTLLLCADDIAAVAFARMLSILMRCQKLRDQPLTTLSRLRQPIALGQYLVMDRDISSEPFKIPSAFALWALTSSDVDTKLTAGQSTELSELDWSSGTTVWIVEVAGEEEGKAHLIRYLAEVVFEGVPVKCRVIDDVTGQPRILHLNV